MTDETEQKILDAALKLFSEKGYAGATTRVIAVEAGFTEMTVYTKFKTKQNLFNQVMIYGMGKLYENESMLFIDKEFEDPLDFLETYVRNLAELVLNNLEFFKLVFNQDRKTVGPILQESVYKFSKYIEKHIPNQKIDYVVFALDIFSFVYMFNLAMYHGPQDPSREKILEKFSYNLSLSIQ
jgi:AcrR family transcriptional regulator